MAGKKGMKGASLGGRREGAGRPREYAPRIKRGEHFIMERETIGGEIRPPELWRVLSVSADEIEFQCGDDIIVIRRPEADD